MEYKRDFYVCFREARGNYWWKIFTGKKRSHIFLITPCETNSCVIIEMTSGGAGVHAFAVPAATMAREAIEKGCDVVHRSVDNPKMTNAYPKFFRTCVTLAKDFLGIRKFWIVTPGQLFDYLKGV